MQDQAFGLYFCAIFFAAIAIGAGSWCAILWYENRELRAICKANEESVHIGRAVKRLEDGGFVKRCGSALMWKFTPSMEPDDV